MKRTFFGQFIARLKEDTPSYFKKIIIFGASLGALGLGLAAIDFPEKLKWIGNLSSYFITIGAVCTLIANQVVKADKADEVKYKEPVIKTNVDAIVDIKDANTLDIKEGKGE